jgi:hypothetical protein
MVLFSGSVLAQVSGVPASATVYDLEYKVDQNDSFRIRTIGNAVDISPRKNLIVEARYLSYNQRYSWLWLGTYSGANLENLHVCAIDESGGTGTGYDTLIIDTDNNLVMSDDLRTVGMRDTTGKFTNIPPIELAVESNGIDYPCHVKARIDASYGFPTFAFCGYCEGSIVLRGKTYRVALFDDTHNGLFNDRFEILTMPDGRTQYTAGDILAIDVDGDGTFLKEAQDTPETFRLGKYLSLEGRCYEIEVLDNGRKMAVRDTEESCGTVIVTSLFSRYSVDLLSYRWPVQLKGAPGTLFKLPAGRYQVLTWNIEGGGAENTVWQVQGVGAQTDPVVQVTENKLTRLLLDSASLGQGVFSLEKVDEGGRRWRIQGSGALNASTVQVNPDGTARAGFGPPFTATVLAQQNGDSLQLSVDMRGSDGATFNPGTLRVDGALPPVPEFEVRDEQGAVVHRDKFKYG